MDNSLPKQGQNRDNYKKKHQTRDKNRDIIPGVLMLKYPKKKLKGDKHVQNNNLSRQ